MISSKYIHTVTMQESALDLYHEYECLEDTLISSLRYERERQSILILEDAEDIYDKEGNLILFTEKSKNIIERIGDTVRGLVEKAVAALTSVINFIKSKFSHSDKEINLIEKYTHEHPEFKNQIIASYKTNELNIKDPKEVEKFIAACEAEAQKVQSGYYKTEEDANAGFEKMIENFERNSGNIMRTVGIVSGIITVGANLVGAFNGIMKKTQEYKLLKLKVQRNKLIDKNEKLSNDSSDTWKNRVCRKITAVMTKEVAQNASGAERNFGKFLSGIKSVASKLPGYDEIKNTIKDTGSDLKDRQTKNKSTITSNNEKIDRLNKRINSYEGKNNNGNKDSNKKGEKKDKNTNENKDGSTTN